jgi:methionyl-tRNA formyltransferase
MAGLRVVMMGTGTFAEPTFEALLGGPHPVVGLVTQPDRPGGHERGSTRQTGRGLKAIAQEKGVPVFQPESVNTPEGVAGLREMRPDLLVVAAYGQILSKDVLAVPSHGGINVHASLLPKYRGAAPVAWAIYHGETHTGVTIIRMTTGLDAGDMLAQEALDIRPDETAGELEARLAPLGAGLALHVVDQTADGTAQGVKQDKGQVTKAPKLKKEDGLIDWGRTAVQVCNHIRAMQPWPTAYTFWHHAGKPPMRLILNRAIPAEAHALGDGLPSGSVLSDANTSPPRLLVIAGEGTSVQVMDLQPAGKRRMSAVEFLRGHSPAMGDHFGPESS